jgi:hypothetical protein
MGSVDSVAATGPPGDFSQSLQGGHRDDLQTIFRYVLYAFHLMDLAEVKNRAAI